MTRLRHNGLTATLGAALAAADTSVTFAAALTSASGAVPTIAAGDYLALSILDAGGNVAEIVHLTAYTSGATTGTIARAQEGTTAADHASGAKVVHSATVDDFASGAVQSVVAGPGITVDDTDPANPKVAIQGDSFHGGYTSSANKVVLPSGVNEAVLDGMLIEGVPIGVNVDVTVYVTSSMSQQFVGKAVIYHLRDGNDILSPPLTFDSANINNDSNAGTDAPLSKTWTVKSTSGTLCLTIARLSGDADVYSAHREISVDTYAGADYFSDRHGDGYDHQIASNTSQEIVVATINEIPLGREMSLEWAVAASVSAPGASKSGVFRVRDGGVGGVVLASQNFTPSGDTSSGLNNTWTQSSAWVTASDVLVLTVQNTTNGDAGSGSLYSAYASLSATVDGTSFAFPAYPTSARPTTPPTAGVAYFDTTLSRPVWSDGTQYVDATGTAV